MDSILIDDDVVITASLLLQCLTCSEASHSTEYKRNCNEWIGITSIYKFLTNILSGELVQLDGGWR